MVFFSSNNVKIEFSENKQISKVFFTDETEIRDASMGFTKTEAQVMAIIAGYNQSVYKKDDPNSHFPTPELIRGKNNIGLLDPDGEFWKAYLGVKK